MFIDPNDNGIISLPHRRCMEKKDDPTYVPENVTAMPNGDWVLTHKLDNYNKWLNGESLAG